MSNPFNSLWLANREAREQAKHDGNPEGLLAEKLFKSCEDELKLHNQIIAHCNAQWPRWKYIRSRPDHRSTIARGCNDLTIFMPGMKLLLCECKRGGGKLSLDQQAWNKELEMLGWKVRIVYSFEQFLSEANSV